MSQESLSSRVWIVLLWASACVSVVLSCSPRSDTAHYWGDTNTRTYSGSTSAGSSSAAGGACAGSGGAGGQSGGTSVGAGAPPSCCGGLWQHQTTGELLCAGLGLREPPNAVTYGMLPAGGHPFFPSCKHVVGAIRLPLFMVDWHDFDPSIDQSNPNNPGSIHPNYERSTPAELSLLLNGEYGLAAYFYDVSGGHVSIDFDVFGWLCSGDDGVYLDARASYLSQIGDNWWTCDRDELFLDTLRDMIAFHDLILSNYDADANGVLDGAAFVSEGPPGLCSGSNMSWLSESFWPNQEPPGIAYQTGSDLVPNSDLNTERFIDQHTYLQFYVNLPERFPPGDLPVHLAIWAHEIGHLLFGFPDYYHARFNLDGYGLSGHQKLMPSHLAAFEKHFFARWIDAVELTSSGMYELQANEIADGSCYDAQVAYLYLIRDSQDPGHFLTIENRFFADDGNTQSRWADNDNLEGGLVIVEVNQSRTYFDTDPPQLYRHAPKRLPVQSSYYYTTFRSDAGDSFNTCFKDECVTIVPLVAPSMVAVFEVTIL